MHDTDKYFVLITKATMQGGQYANAICSGTVHLAEAQEGIILNTHVHIAGVYRWCNVTSGLVACRKQTRYQQQRVKLHLNIKTRSQL